MSVDPSSWVCINDGNSLFAITLHIIPDMFLLHISPPRLELSVLQVNNHNFKFFSSLKSNTVHNQTLPLPVYLQMDLGADFLIDAEALSLLSCQAGPYETSPSSGPSSEGRSAADVYAACSLSREGREIRTMVLEGADDPNDPLVASFRVVSLDAERPPCFNALSYVWGERGTDTVRCDLVDIAVTKNCWHALRRIRSLYHEITIWVDAICIDQTNINEKEHQIALMREIYLRADTVYIWLDNETAAMRQTMECLSLAAKVGCLPLDRRSRKIHSGWEVFKLIVERLPPCGLVKTFYDRYNWSRFISAYRTNGFVEVFHHTWLLRSWTFQEAVLANNAVVITSSATMGWDALARGLGFMCKSFPRNGIGRVNCAKIYYKETNQPFFSSESNYVWNGYDKPIMPDSSAALEALLVLWLRIDRSGVVPNGQHETEGAPCSIYQEQKTYFDVYNKLKTYRVILAVFRLVQLWLCYPLLPWITGTLSVFAHPDSDGYLASTISSLCILVTHVLSERSFNYLWIGVLIFVSFFSIDGVAVGVVGENDRSDVGSAFDPLLDAILQTLRDRSATDPKDKSYAMYGILKSLGVRLSKLDYRKSRGQIYHELLVDLLRWRPAAVTLLLDSGTSDGNSGGTEPSWVPDWSSLPLSPSMSTNLFLSNRRLDAAPSAQPHIQLEEHERTLLVEGHWCGTVSSCIDRFQEIESLPDDPDDIESVVTLRDAIKAYASWVNILRAASRPVYPSYRLNTILEHRLPNCTLGLDRPPQLRVPCNCDPYYHRVDEKKLGAVETHMLVQQLHSTDSCEPLKSMRAIHSAFVCIWEMSGPESRHLCPASVSAVINMLCRDNVLSVFRSLINDMAINDRRLFTTSEGYLGCGSKDIKMGNRLALIGGIPAPLVLRPLDVYPTDWFETKYIIRCSAFVLGWMNGSAFERNRARAIRLV